MNKKFRIGDKVKVVGMSPVTYPPGMKDELGTEKLFKSMLGKVYTVRGFDRYGMWSSHPELLRSEYRRVETESFSRRPRRPKSKKRKRNRRSGVQYLAMNKKFRIGDKVKVVGMSPVTYPPGMKDELGTEKLFKSMLGRLHRSADSIDMGMWSFNRKRDTVWVEPEFLKLRARKSKKRKRK